MLIRSSVSKCLWIRKNRIMKIMTNYIYRICNICATPFNNKSKYAVNASQTEMKGDKKK